MRRIRSQAQRNVRIYKAVIADWCKMALAKTWGCILPKYSYSCRGKRPQGCVPGNNQNE